MKRIDLSKVHCIQFEGIDYKDCPDFCDVFISYAEHDGIPMTENELDWLNDYENNDWKYEQLMNHLY